MSVHSAERGHKLLSILFNLCLFTTVYVNVCECARVRVLRVCLVSLSTRSHT